jgi:hypothetical protein
VIVLAPPGIPVKEIPREINQTLQKLEERIKSFEEAVVGRPTVPKFGVLPGDSKKHEKGTILDTISSAQYIVQ